MPNYDKFLFQELRDEEPLAILYFNRIEQQPIQQDKQWHCWRNRFQTVWFHDLVTSCCLFVPQIWLQLSFFLWGYPKSKGSVTNPPNCSNFGHYAEEGHSKPREKSAKLSKHQWSSSKRYCFQKCFQWTMKMFFFDSKPISTTWIPWL